MPRQPEGKLVARINRRITERGGRVFKIQGSEESFQEVGIPDDLICFMGLFIGMEVKQPGKPLRPAQRAVLREIYAAGGIAAVVETVGQVDSLLSYIEDRRSSGKASRRLAFDRGRLLSDRDPSQLFRD